ncbi:MAG: Hsp33 family molecular chaperone HslO [Alphaproteobacteria bacterium]|nr:Hsp33 family molecular chaperone HslO [Alphaproteobacteria bacterium]
MNNFDNCVSFHIDNGSFLGRFVRLDDVVNTILTKHSYPKQVSAVVAESTALATLLASTLKYKGLFTLQTKSNGPVPMVVVDVTSEGGIRACADYDENKIRHAQKLRKTVGEIEPAPHFMGEGILAFTVDQGPETDLYQGIVDLQGKNLSECAMRYFKQSEQIETYLKLYLQAPQTENDRWKSAGILLQKLPSHGGSAVVEETELAEAWNQAVIFMQSLQESEVFDSDLDSATILNRLYHADNLHITQEKNYTFACRCSRDKLFNTLHAMKPEEISDMCENGKITATCHFCGSIYSFDKGELINQ